MMMVETTVRDRIDQACRVGEEFVKLYYAAIDKRRHMMARLYLDNALLIWNGNGVSGNDAIQKFLLEIPTTEHKYITLDSQPILDNAIAGQPTFLIQVSGNVRFTSKVPKNFQQNFLVTAVGDKWKIVTDSFRLQEPIDY